MPNDPTQRNEALYALDDIEAMSNIMRQATHRTQMNLIAEAAGIDLTMFVQETAPGAPLERLGLISYRGGRDEISDINVSRPLLFALRSNTLDDLKAGLFAATPAPQFGLSEFSIPLDETRTCAAAVRGEHPLLIAGEPGIGKTEFARALVDSLGRRAHTLAALNRHSEHHRGPPRMMSHLTTAAEMMEIEHPAADEPDRQPQTADRAQKFASAAKAVEEILANANANAQDRTRGIGF